MASTLVDLLKTDNGLDGKGFLQGDDDLEKLLGEFGRKGDKKIIGLFETVSSFV